MADTVRTVTMLLTTLFQDGQVGGISAQDMRDLIVSLALQNGNFSDLPTSPASLTTGRVWLNGTVLNVVP